MRFGLSINDTFGSALDDALWAESVGLDRIAIPDHVLRAQAADPALAAGAPAPDPFIQLAAIAMSTSRIELATLVSPVTFRHPATLLKASIELSIVSNGRFTLGLGTGYRELEHECFGNPFPSRAERYLLLEETLGYVSAGLTKPNPGFEGERHRLAAQEIAPPPNRVRLLVGGGGARRTPQIAGGHADEYNTFLTDPAAARERFDIARKAFADAGRVGELTISVAAPLVIGETAAELNKEAARQAARRGLTADDYLEQQRRTPTALVGSPQDVAERIIPFEGLGVSSVTFVYDGPVDRDGVIGVLAACGAADIGTHPINQNRESKQ